MSNQVCPGWNDTTFLSEDTEISSSFSKLMVMPPSMLEPPATAECPPLFAAKGHCVRRDRRIEVDTSRAFAGLKTHSGEMARCWPDQNAFTNSLYAVSDRVST